MDLHNGWIHLEIMFTLALYGVKSFQRMRWGTRQLIKKCGLYPVAALKRRRVGFKALYKSQITTLYIKKKCWSRRMHWRWPMYKLYISRIEIQSYWNSTGIAITEIDCKETEWMCLVLSQTRHCMSVLFVFVLLRVGFIVLIPFSFYLRSLNAWLSQCLAN